MQFSKYFHTSYTHISRTFLLYTNMITARQTPSRIRKAKTMPTISLALLVATKTNKKEAYMFSVRNRYRHFYSLNIHKNWWYLWFMIHDTYAYTSILVINKLEENIHHISTLVQKLNITMVSTKRPLFHEQQTSFD